MVPPQSILPVRLERIFHHSTASGCTREQAREGGRERERERETVCVKEEERAKDVGKGEGRVR